MPRSRIPWAIRANCPATLMVIASRVTAGRSFSGSWKTQPILSRFSGRASSSSSMRWTFSTVPVKLVRMISRSRSQTTSSGGFSRLPR